MPLLFLTLPGWVKASGWEEPRPRTGEAALVSWGHLPWNLAHLTWSRRSKSVPSAPRGVWAVWLALWFWGWLVIASRCSLPFLSLSLGAPERQEHSFESLPLAFQGTDRTYLPAWDCLLLQLRLMGLSLVFWVSSCLAALVQVTWPW